MRLPPSVSTLLIAALALCCAGCIRPLVRATPPQPYGERLASLTAALDGCGTDTGHVPAGPVSVGQAAAPGDSASPLADQAKAAAAAYRACTHTSLLAIMTPNSRFAPLYQEFVAEDRALSAAVAAGKVAPSARIDRLRAMLATLDANERLDEEARRAAQGERMLNALAAREAELRLAERSGEASRLAVDVARRLTGAP